MKKLPGISNSFAIAALIVVFLLPELIVWIKIDSLKEPLRSYRGDTAHYMTVLNGALQRGPEGNSFFYEEQEHDSRFQVFEFLVRGVGYLTNIPASVFAIILGILVPLVAFLLFYLILVSLGVVANTALFVALLHVVVYGVVVYDGYGLAFWFVPFLLLGLYMITRSIKSDIFDFQSGLLLSLSIIPLTIHPAYFVFGGALAAVAWFILARRHGVRILMPYFLLWLILSGLLFLLLFAGSLGGSVASEDTLVRMALVQTRFPIHPILMIELLCVGVALFSRKQFNLLSSAFLIGFAALLAPTITGSYLVNDHYVIAHDYLIIAAALLLIYSAGVKKQLWLGGILLITTLVDIFLVLNYFNFNFGYYGKYATIHASLFAISLILIWPDTRLLARKVLESRKIIIAAFALAITYALLLQYKDTVNSHLARDTQAQIYRPLVETLRKLPPGVVLADNDLSFFLPIFTPHKIYWSTLAVSHPAPTANILKRFEDADLFFSDDFTHQPPVAASAIFGAINKCEEFHRGDMLKKLADYGFRRPYQEICSPVVERQAKYNAVKAVLAENQTQTLARKEWVPAFRVNYLVISDKDKNVPSWLIKKYFTQIASIPGFIIYSYDR
mgnify:CR=1 FL=1